MRTSFLLISLAAYAAIGAAAFAWGRLHEQRVLEADRREVMVQLEVLHNAIESAHETAEAEARQRSIVVRPLKAI